MSEILRVRDMTLSDIEQCLQIIEVIEPYLLEQAQVEVRDGFHGKPREQEFVVAEIGNRIVGLLGHLRDVWGTPDIWWLNWLYVDPEIRRQGVATNLLLETERRLRKKGCRKVYLDVGNEDTHLEALALYERVGFKLEGKLIDFWRTGEDFLVFGKPISKEPL